LVIRHIKKLLTFFIMNPSITMPKHHKNVGNTIAMKQETNILPTAYPIMERFYTLQGEGAYSGQAAYFIRIAGCDVGCTWCDVKDSWDANLHSILPVTDLVADAAEQAGKIVVVTGGEPLMYNLAPLTKALHAAGLRTHIETSGAHPLSGDWDWICLSPKKFKQPLDGVAAHANELKIIVYNKHDLLWAELYAEQVGENCMLLLQPEWSREKEMLPMMIEYVKNNPKWRISLQTHKYMEIP
jgi:7-carboxy-7-deazaguanine synthase